MGECAMRADMIAELGGSLIITAITGLYTFGGLALAGYSFLAVQPNRRRAHLTSRAEPAGALK